MAAKSKTVSNNSAAITCQDFTKLRVSTTPIESLKINAENCRLHSEKQIAKIAECIKKFGFNIAILTDKRLKVCAGHGRLRAAKLLGMSHVPTIPLDHLTEDQIKAFAIADNRLSELSEWDDQLLGQQFKSLSVLNLDFSLETTGFETAEIDLLIDGAAPAPEGRCDPADFIPDEGPTQFEISQPGDLWLLEEHRILCGDALDAPSYPAILEGHQAAMVFTDPPYNTQIAGYAAGHGKTRHAEFRMGSGEMTAAQHTDFLRESCARLKAHSRNGSLHFIFMDWRHQYELLSASRGIYSELENICIWVKDQSGLGSLYRSQHELIFVFKNGNEKHRNNIQLGRYGRNRTNVWNYPSVNSFARPTEERNLLDLHPTVKPVALVADAILDCTARREMVLDPFLGSGTTVIAAERTGRICRGIEIEPKYVDVAIRRWQQLTGKTAIQSNTGRTFAALEEEVHDGRGQ